ncbi:hypothetical protein VOLCADRAFT_118510 [Volvox carteri f. nagariensis]|uniref:RING-type domain-containing protein n=1 Tax=Volvox carteri f. nagariensis TaxID=3068 RepID=D8U5H1_VOLCA|nr:uncharacterized protein VOLCADRAFT_118510 [Volvox carteri f. nagariensis]EFJ44918.1 hypothetical protein VOLCADRAFT_118510 [Volvox carteri f. nagariensis]|eukprot:XP_002953889.1 hypothetical protein VOLCADRAFT_118510 [Volvox carteri f. nagariensis]
MSVEAWQDFGQKVDLTARIREILLNYPEGTSILKELVQNADDARATCIKFCLDCRQHGTRSLLSPAMAPFQGPALLAFNDGVFSDRDLESISRIGDSKKKDEEGKTGRFGVGFNSCYHLTDVPSFVSGRHLVIFDPHCRHLPNISSTNPGKRIDFVQYGDVAAQYADQVAPYAGAFGCTLGAGGGGAVSGGGSGSLGPWSGTLFRFPLRSAELAEASTISKQIYTIESIRTLLEQLATESFQILLFLKHISRVEIHEWAPDAAAPHILFSCYVSNLSREVAWERGLFARVSRDRPSQQNVDQAASGGGGIRVPLPEVLASYRLELLREWHDGGGGIGAVVRRPERRSYIISQMRGGGEAAEMAEQLSKLFGAVVAWGAVAADVTTVAGAAGGGGDAAAAAAAGQLEDGRAFCFLPLPIRTGLPVHVNGYFELSSNRRDIWYGEDMTGSGARRAQWNIQLLLRVIAPAYVAALTAAAAVLGHGEAYDRLWPAADVAQPWQSLLEEFFRRVADMALCWSTIRGGCWVAPRSGVLRDQVVAASPPLAAALVEVAELPLLELPPGVGQLMLRHMWQHLGHYGLRHLRRRLWGRHQQELLLLQLLQLVRKLPKRVAAQLVGLRLLPLLDGTTATLCAAVPGGKQHPQTQQQSSPQHRGGHPAAPYPSCFLPTAEECTLLARAGGLLVDANELSPTGRSKLEALAAARVLNFAKLDSLAMAAVVLPQLLPPAWLPARAVGGAAAGGRVVDWEIDPAGQAAGVDREWLQLLWRWLATHGSLPCFVGLPLLPILGGRLAPFADAASSISVLPPAEVVQRAAAGAGGRVVSTADGGVGAAADRAAQLAELLTQLGLQIVDLETFPDLPVSELLRGGHVHRCDGPGILAALQRLSAATHHPQAGRTTQAPVPQPAGGGPPIDGVGEQPASDGNGRGRPVLSAGLAARVTALAAADKHLLRSILLTEDCLTALTASGPSRSATSAGKPALPQAEARGLLQLLAALPIYESAKGAGAAATAAAAAGSSGGSGLQAAEPVFMALHGSGGTCFLAPHGVDVRVLGSLHGSIFVVAASEAEGRLMVTYLGVRAITAAEAFRHHVLPGLVLLPGELRNATVLDMLRGLPQLSAQDRGFGAWLAQVPFVPNNKVWCIAARRPVWTESRATSHDVCCNALVTQGELHTPGELYDPRNPDLAALLDPEADFPAASLLLQAAGSASSAATNGGGSTGNGGEASGGAPAAAAASSTDEDGAGDASLVLYMLQQLGLRTAATLDTLLQAARFVERIADAAAAAAVAATTATAAAADAPERPSAPQAPPVAASTTSAAAEDSDMAVARGKALLAYLEAEAGRIMGPVGASPAPAMSASVGAAGTTGAAGAGSGGGSGLGTGGGARRFAAGLFSKARELFGQGTQEQPAVAEVHNFWQELARIRWCPVLQDPPAPGLPWPARHAVPRLAAPRTIRPPSDMWLCSSCMFLVDGECRSSALAAGLGWSGRLGGSVLAQQLLQLGEMHTQVTDPALSQVLAGVVPLLYRSLAELGLHEAPVARGLLYGSRCVWVGNGFAPAGKVAFKGSLDLSPWLYVMPAELAPFKDLLLSYGAADGFSAVQYCSVLQDMAEATGAVGSASVSAATAAAAASSSPALPPPPPPPQPLMEVQLGQVVAVAQALADLTLPAGAIIYLPDERGVLARAGDLAFNDAPWLAGQPSAASVRLVHPRISAHVAARLGTPSLRRLLLAASADCMALGTVGGAEAFGQSEALTTRLRHIIADYPEGPGVLMELLQNADDAGATSLELLLDDTTYPASSILSPAMAVWQGPALLVANDAVFSPADFANISRIGQDSKASRPTSIGRFGLGFNAVYHFTDLPCFVSGDYLVMFDPHAKYLPGVSAAQPGLKIAFARAQLLQQFPDAFTPFTHLGCNMQERFMGTLFRFPLRGPAAAAASDIKTTPCSPEDVAALLESFRRQLPAALLFLKNIRLVTAYYRSAPSPPAADSGGEACLQLLFRASREMVPPAGAAETASLAAGGDGGAEAAALQLSVSELSGAGEQNGLLQSAITRFIAGSASDPSDLASFYKRLANTSATGLPSEMGLMQLQMETNLTLPPGGIAAVASGGGGAASATSASSAAEASSKPGHRAVPGMVTERWLVCNALGGGGARDMALKSFRNHSTKMVPWVGVAARVPSAVGGAVGGEVLATAKGDAGGDDSGGGLDGRAFCFLPLPIRTGLPVHVNGYFELSSNRRDIWYGGDMAGAGAARSSWNVALMADALGPCYGRVLVAVARRVGPGQQLYRLLPSLETPQPWSHLVSALYQHQLGQLPIVWTRTRAGDGRWITPTAALFSDAACAAEPLLRNLLVALGMPLACDMPPEAEARLLRGVPSATAVEPQHVRRHLANMLRAAGGDSAAVGQQITAAAAAAADADIVGGGAPQHKAASATMGGGQLPQPLAEDAGGGGKAPIGASGSAGGQQAAQSQQQNQQQQQQQQLQKLQQELDGLPLLPLADGTLGRLQVTHQGAPASGKSARGRNSAPAPAHVYVLTHGSLELEMLAGLRNRCLAPGLPGPLVERLQRVVDLRLFNVQRLSPALLDSTLLSLLLPPSWQGAVEPQQPQQPQQQVPVQDPQSPPVLLPPPSPGPTAEWIRALWAWLANREDVLQLASWPVLPIQGGRLGTLQEKSLVLREGDWTEGVTSALLRLGCRLLDTALLEKAAGAGAGAAASPALQACVQQPSLSGVMAAIAAAKARGARPTSGPMAEPWSVRLSGLTAVERRQLRSYLLQSRWFTGSTPPLAQEGLDLLRSLPIFEVFPDPVPAASAAKAPPPPPAEPARAAAGSSASASAQQQQQQQQQQQPSQQQQQQAAAQLQHFTALDPKRHRLAPSDTDPRVLSSAFLRVDSPAEEALLERHLGVPRLSHPQLLQQHVGPRASELPRDALGTYVAGLLCRLAEVAGMWGSAANVEAQALRQALSEHPLIPTAAPSGDLRRPSELHDPRLPVLTSLLPPDSAFFPAASLTVPAAAGAVTAAGAPPSRLLDALGFLGMARAVDLRVLLTAARALQTDHAAWASASMASVTQAAAAAASASSSALSAVTDASLLSRARALLQQLELWAGQYGSSGGGAGASPGREEDPKRAWEQLSGLSWCPVLREAPEPGLPWPSMPTPLLAPPRLVRPPADAWLAALGWNAMPRVSVLAAQLIQLGRLHAYKPKRLTQTEAEPQLPPPPQAQTEAVADGGADAGGGANSDTESSGGSADAQLSSVPEPAKSSEGKPTTDGAADAAASTLNKALESAVHRLYDSLSAAIDGPEGDLVAMSFERPDPDSPCVWVGAGFVLPGVAVLRSEGDFRPYLWVVPEPLHQYGRLLSLMGVMDRFTAQHYASGLASLAAAAAGSPLDDDSLALALQLADCAADALAAYGRPTGHFFVPDAAAVMTPGPELFFNDAEWLDARHVQMAHGALPQTTAEALGVRSLRYAHEVEAQLTAALPCPSPGELRERLGLAAAQASEGRGVADPSGASAAGASAGEAAAATFLFELLEVADALGLRGVRLVLDVRQHPAQSLLQPALAAFQGPALCVVLPEVVLSTEEVAGLLCSRAQPPSIRGRVAAYSAGLQSAFLVSEILQVVSGDTTYMFDPSGIYLGSGTGSTAGSGGGGGGAGRGRGGALSPRAKQYKHASSDLLSTFADQFAVWSFADEYDIRSPINATLLRLPLRRASPPPLGSVAAGAAGAAAIARARGESVAAADTRGLRNGGLAAATLESVEAALRQFVVHAPRSLLFLHCLHGIMVSLLRPQPAASEATASTASAGAATGSTAAGTGAATGSRAVREVLLQARVVTLDTDRLRPDFAALGAAARQRSSGPAALKALAQAFGRSLGRGGNQDNPKHYLCPLELHVMAHNALLLPTEPAAVSESPPSASASTPPPPVKPRGGGSGALGLNSVEGAVQGATVYRERWLVSSCHDLDGVPLSPAAAAASGGGGRPELVAAAAVCIGRDDQRNLFITSGLYAPVYLPATPSGSGSGGSGGGAALGRMPFLVAGHFYLLRRNGKHVVPPFARAEGAAGGGSGATPNTDAGVPGPGGPVTPPLLPQLQHRCEHNRRVLDLAATAWQNLALFFCSQDQYNGPRERLYDIFPDMAAATAANAGGIADETALYCVRQMYAAAARLPLWRLRTGRFVHLPEGCFLQPTTEGLGTAAMGFMARQLPLFDVPWITKQHLESADVHGLRTVSPAVVRPLLKNLGRRQVAGAGSAKIAWPGLTVLEATELLLFCSADLVAEVTAASTAAPAADAASGASAPAGVGSARAGGRGQAAAPAAPPMGGGGSSPGQQQAGGVGGLLDGLTSQVRNVVGELVGPALYDQLRQQHGSVESLGSTLLLVAPPLPALPTPAVLLPPHCGPEFVHPDCVAKMVEHFKDPQYRSSLELRLYTLDNLARHLRTALPPGWDHPMASGAALQPSPSPAQQQQRQQNQHSDPRVGPTGLGRTWDGGSGGQQGDGPSGLWLWQLWALVNGLLEAAREWQAIGGGSGSEGRLEPLHNWPLLPVLGSRAGTAVLLPEPALPAPWNWLAPALHAIGCPLLDPRFRAAAGRHCAPHADGLPARGLAEAAAVAGSAATPLVEKMRLCNAACGGALPLRCGAEWDDATRAAVLGLLAEATPTNIDPADIIFLRRLPIYPTHGGVYTALEEGSPGPSTTSSSAADAAAAAAVETGAETTAAAAPPVVCSAELLHLVPGLDAALPASAPRRLLLPQPGASRLYTLLGVASLGAAGFLAAVALPHLERLPEEVRVMLLTHVQANWSRLRSDDALLAVLRDTPFVLVADGALKRPGELYDPDHPLFAAAFLGCPVFPRDQFATPAWLTVLRDAGMQHKVTAAAFMSAAEAVAARGAALHMTLPVEGLPEHGTSLEDPFLADGATEVPSPVAGARAKQGPALGGGREWWASLAKVAFVPASLGLPGSRKARQLLTRYSDAAAASDWPLVWSVLPTVAAERQVPAALGQGQLRIKSPPPLAAVVAHLRRVGADGGEEALGGWPASAGGVEDAFRTVLSYLDREGVTGQKAAQLRDVAFVPVARGTLLAPPRRLYVRLKEDFAPFAFEVPPSLASFTPLLKSLGAQDEPRAQDLVESLRALAAAVGPQPLSPNQRAAVIRLMSHVAALGGAGAANGPGGGAGGGGGTVGGSAADLTYLATARRERRLLVLSSDGRLVPAHSAVSVGEGGGVGAGAGRLLGRLDPGALTLAHPALSESVTRWLGCPRLADVAEERLDPGHPLEPVEEIQGLTLRDARALLASPAFVSACHALLRTHAPLVRGITTHGSLHEVAAVLRTAAPHLTFVRSLRTTAVLRSTGAALSPAAEASRVAFDFVEVAAVAPPPSAAAPSPPFGVISSLAPKSSPGFGAGSGLGRIFIAEPPQHLPVSWLLASVVSRVLGSPVVLPLQPLFTTPSSELQQLQPVLLPGGFDAGLETAAQAGTPGAPLLPSDAALLQLKPLRRYCAGEVVAYQRNAAAVPAAAAAAAAAARRAVATPDVPLAITSNMCYGRVAAHCAPTDSAAATGGAAGAGAASGGVHRVLVEVEPGVVQHLLSTQVFCFSEAALTLDCASRHGGHPYSQLVPTLYIPRSPSSDTASAATTTADPALAATATTSQPADHPTIADRSGGTSSGSGAPLPSSVLSRGGGGGPEAAAPRPSSGGGVMAPVSSQEMLAAVRDMMAAAGLPLDPAAGQLMGRVAALQEQLSEVQGQLAQAKREATSSASEAEAARGAWQCKICFSRDVDSAYTGCGHTICALCANAASTNRCPVCRKPSQSLLRLYRA